MTLEQMKKRFSYNPSNGNLYLLDSNGKEKKLVTSISTDGYLQVNPKESKRPLFAHRIIYQLYHNIELNNLIIDHIDQNKTNNKINNLRAVTRAQNNQNLALRKTNKSGVSNVYQLPNGKWRAQIRVKRKLIHLGCFETIEEAAQAKKEANIKYGFTEHHN